MAFVKTIDPQQAEGRLAKLYKQVGSTDGQVDNVLQIHSLRPHSLEGHMALYKSVLHHTGNTLPKWFLEAVGVYVSRLNRCDYCDEHHTAGMKRLLQDQPERFHGLDKALSKPSPGSPFTEAEQLALAWVKTLTVTPSAINPASVDELRVAGFEDGQIVELNQVAAYFAYANRSVLGLGASTEGEVLGLSPNQGDGWEHS